MRSVANRFVLGRPTMAERYAVPLFVTFAVVRLDGDSSAHPEWAATFENRTIQHCARAVGHNRPNLGRRIASFRRPAPFRYTYCKLAPETVLRRVADGSGAGLLLCVKVVPYLDRVDGVALHSLLEFAIRQREAVMLPQMFDP
jgi:hypothetical protein